MVDIVTVVGGAADGADLDALKDTFAMLDGHGEMIIVVEGLMSAGSRCCQLCKEQEGAVTAAAALQVAQDVRDVMEVCAAQLVRGTGEETRCRRAKTGGLLLGTVPSTRATLPLPRLA